MYYSIDKVNRKAQQEGANIIIIYGGKSKGKTYQAKTELMIKNYFKTGKRFCLVRRYDVELNKSKCELYFNIDLPPEKILELTGGKYNGIEYKSSNIYCVLFGESGKVEKREHIGYIVPLNKEQNFSSILSGKDINNIIFEEFQSRTTYLPNECDKLEFLYSTIDREQGTTKLYLLGNAISKASPYWEHYGILDIIKKQKTGTIETHTIEGKKIILEKTKSFNDKKTTIGASANAISRGDWYFTKQPHIKQKGHIKGLLYINFDFSGLLFVGSLCLTEKKEPYWFIRSVDFFKDTKKTYTVSTKVKAKHNYAGSIYNFKNERLNKIIGETFRRDRIFYSTDEVGTDFNTAIPFNIRR